jgi:GNAT superfamily N-acetyltransferase
LGQIDAKKARKDIENQSKKLYVDGKIFVAEINKKVVGIIGYWRLEHHPKWVAWMDWFAVDKEYQNRGIGSRLLLHMIKNLLRADLKCFVAKHLARGTLQKFSMLNTNLLNSAG